MSLQGIDVRSARRILDFSGGDEALRTLGELQLRGAVALYNMIADPEVGMGYLADEVGMGKTYIALGVVALMRYFNPSLRVLFICPSKNVQEKWYAREYQSFTRHNVKVNQYRIRTPEGRPAAPRVSCRNVPELIRAASSGYYADFFVGMGAFSIGLSEDEDQWERKLDELQFLLPARKRARRVRDKQGVKDQYAQALNYVLPMFDLVVIDEAHNFKHDFHSSDRNYVLSGVLGFRHQNDFVPRVKNALLLSATPYDRDLNQLRNQLKLVGKEELLPESLPVERDDEVRRYLRRFLVRRLNELKIAGTPHTRNMYRREWRSGERAEVELDTDEQKLITALVQKKVGEMLSGREGSPSFQTGLLASFESYGESTKSPPVEFDGDVTEREQGDAEDRNVIGAIRDSYVKAELGRTLPHPKMDFVTDRLAREIFDRGRKQIVFVRRVKSVKEIKEKLDDHYNDWLFRYIRGQLGDFPEAMEVFRALEVAYRRLSRHRDGDIAGGEYRTGESEDAEDRQPPSNDTFFSWFFRGEADAAQSKLLDTGGGAYTTPDLIRSGLAARNQVISPLLEINWAREICRSLDVDLRRLCKDAGAEIAQHARAFSTGETQNDLFGEFQAAQLGFIDWYGHVREIPAMCDMVRWISPVSGSSKGEGFRPGQVPGNLEVHTFFDALEQAGLSDVLVPRKREFIEALFSDGGFDPENLRVLEIHRSLLGLCLRTGHGIIDLYLARLRQGTENLTKSTRASWMDDVAARLREQSTQDGFSTFRELHDLADQLDLVIKSNLPDAYDKTREEYRLYFSRMLNPVAPIMGASGATVGSRSAQARKFRMPGYPLALVSTDVFQEGEDLHTFCDSVVHYGLSGSPVHIEQKTGRVDRIASQAQRRLLSLKASDDVQDDKLIQVTFPYVKESIETLQVRQLCGNLNRFLESLHEIGRRDTPRDDRIDMDRVLQDRSAIPEQIRERLRSPYVPDVPEHAPELNREPELEAETTRVDRMSGHVHSLLQEYFGGAVPEAGRWINVCTRGEVELSEVRLTSARASGELLLKAHRPAEEISLGYMTRNALAELMEKESWRSLSRTYAVPVANRGFRLYHDSELLIGEELNTWPGEIERFFERFSLDHDPSEYAKPASKLIVDCWKRARSAKSTKYGQLEASVAGSDEHDHLRLVLSFGAPGNNRRHKIRIYEYLDRCIFLSTAADKKVVKGLTVDQIVSLTWERNALTDVVEFMFSPDLDIVGRAVQPIEGLTLRKFLYCAYTLATATDRLEYLIQEPDLH